MKRVEALRSVATVALLLPALVLATPVAGSCGRCGNDGICRLQQPEQPSHAEHACCAAGRQETSPEPSLGGSTCRCGRDSVPATIGDAQLLIDGSAVESPAPVTTAAVVLPTVIGGGCGRSPAPPPSPPVFLVDCAFLT